MAAFSMNPNFLKIDLFNFPHSGIQPWNGEPRHPVHPFPAELRYKKLTGGIVHIFNLMVEYRHGPPIVNQKVE